MALPFPGNSFRLLFRRRRLAALLIAGGLGLMQAPAEVGAFYWTVLAPDIVNPGREEQGSISV